MEKDNKIHYPQNAEKLFDIQSVTQSIQTSCPNLMDKDLVLIGMERKRETPCSKPYQLESLLGKLRLSLYSYGQEMKLLHPFDKITSSSPLTFLWVQNFPLFEYDKEGKMKPCHHPFTSPLNISSVTELEQCSDIMNVISSSCDLVLNGNEVGGGYHVG